MKPQNKSFNERRFIRDSDIHNASRISAEFDQDPENHFILTGSYSIEALTDCDEISHNDIDANIFTQNIPKSLAKTSLIMCSIGFDNLKIFKKTDSRLEYFIDNPIEPRKMEIQFIEFDEFSDKDNRKEFSLKLESDKVAIIPTTNTELKDSNNDNFVFQVKTLDYAIATWALRISGVANKQKREVRKTDIDHFKILLSNQHDYKDIYNAIMTHPQMPENASPEQIIDIAITIMNNFNPEDHL